jgi:hypothetical protein
MKALRIAPSDDKVQLDAKCKELITRAERIKAAADWQSAARQKPVSKLQPPTSKRKLTTREEIIVLEGAKLNGFIFPPWERAPTPVEFEQPFTYVQNECFSDISHCPPCLTFSKEILLICKYLVAKQRSSLGGNDPSSYYMPKMLQPRHKMWRNP